MDFEKLNMEFQKIKRSNKFVWAGFGFFIAGVIFGSVIFLMIGAIILIVFMTISAKYKITTYDKIKDEIYDGYVYPCLNEAFRDFKYNPSRGMDTKIIKSLPFINLGNRVYSFNTMEGYYRNIAFVQSGMRCEREQNNSGNSRTQITFSGRVIIFAVSLFEGDGFVDVISSNHFSYRLKSKTKKVTLNNKLDRYCDIYVSNDGITLSESVMDYFADLAINYPEYKFYFRITNDKLYLVIDGIDEVPYSIKNLEYISQDMLDLLIKKDSCFITNTISNILD